MPGTSNGLTQAQIDRRLKGGRGQGQGPDYKPLIYTRDVSSLGRSPRLLGSKTRRLQHLLSDLELAIFLTLDRSTHVTDIREQFPMRVFALWRTHVHADHLQDLAAATLTARTQSALHFALAP